MVAATIPEHEGRVLLTRRTIQPARGKWTFPGGFVDWGEPVEDGAVRETWEETGLDLPFLFDSYDDLHKVTDGPVGPGFEPWFVATRFTASTSSTVSLRIRARGSKFL